MEPGNNLEIKEKQGKANKFAKFVPYLIIIILFATIFLLFFNTKEEITIQTTCGDGTTYSECSQNKPYFCLSGKLISDVENCGCPGILNKFNNSCTSNFYVSPRDVSLKYILRGEDELISLKVYSGVKNYLSKLPRYQIYSENETPNRVDFKLVKINNELQREALMPLVVEIQNLAPNSSEDQVRIAVSLVQNIPYGEPGFVKLFGKYNVRLSRYPYEVLVDTTGSCEGKSELLAFLLKELGYGVSIFYYAEENHEAVGIKCPLKYSLNNSGYCFIETTSSSPISYSTGTYLGVSGGKLHSTPEIMIISEGNSLPLEMDEYEDAKELERIMNYYEEKGQIDLFKKKTLDELRIKYGLKY